MSAAQHKRVAATFFARFTAGDIPGALETMTADATWLIPGRPDAIPTAGLYTKERISRLFHTMQSRLTGGLQMTVKGAIAEGDKVAVEVESRGELSNGRIYNQHYHFLIEFRGGMICAVREYLDTQHAYATWFEPS
jgi:hypothetical protein